MNTKTKFIFVVILTILPIFVFNFVFNLNDTPNYTPKGVFGLYLGLLTFSICLLGILNKFFLNKTFKDYNHPKQNLLTDISTAFLLLAILYFCQSLNMLLFGPILKIENDNTAIITFLENIYANPLNLTLLLGPFTFFNQAFWVISLSFLLQNLWSYSNKKWHYPIIFATALTFSFFSSSANLQNIIFGFLMYTASSIIYYKYRRVIPILAAFLLFMYFDLISFLYYYISII